MINNSQITIFCSQDGQVELNVKLDNDTVWLTLDQMADLFQKNKSTISRHIKNVFEEGELEANSTVAFFATVQKEGERTVARNIAYYSLGVVISVGYRVHSQRGVQFRQWANSVLKQYLVKGYAVDRRRLDHYDELKDVVRLMSRAIALQEDVSAGEYGGLFRVVTDYVYALDTLDRYDYQSLQVGNTTKAEPFRATYENAMEAIRALKEKYGGSQWFANEKDDSFRSSIGQIYQTFGGEDLYPSVEEKAATLLYLVVKNHSFSDGNKRIAAMLFLWFMERNGILYAADGHKRIADNTLVALTLMIAESRTEEKDMMVKVVVNLINKDNR